MDTAFSARERIGSKGLTRGFLSRRSGFGVIRKKRKQGERRKRKRKRRKRKRKRRRRMVHVRRGKRWRPGRILRRRSLKS
jgi:hypothetical protein